MLGFHKGGGGFTHSFEDDHESISSGVGHKGAGVSFSFSVYQQVMEGISGVEHTFGQEFIYLYFKS